MFSKAMPSFTYLKYLQILSFSFHIWTRDVVSSSALPLSSLYHPCLWYIQVRYKVDADINEGIFKTKVLLMLLWIFIMLLIAAKYQTCTCACVQCTCTRYLSLPTRYPWHASCKLQWTFTSLSCSQVQLSSIKRQNR